MASIFNPYISYAPQSHSQTPLENRMSAVFEGEEAFFADYELSQALDEIERNFSRVVVLHDLPEPGFHRITAWNQIIQPRQ